MKSTHLPTTWINMMKGFISYNIHLFVAFDCLKKWMRSYDLNISVQFSEVNNANDFIFISQSFCSSSSLITSPPSPNWQGISTGLSPLHLRISSSSVLYLVIVFQVKLNLVLNWDYAISFLSYLICSKFMFSMRLYQFKPVAHVW